MSWFGELQIAAMETKMKYILIDYAYVVAVEAEKLEYTKNLILSNNSKAVLIVEDNADDCMRHAKLEFRLPKLKELFE